MSTAKTLPTRPASSFRRAVWRGLGVVLPPLLTIVILFWIGNTVKQYGYDPMMAFAQEVLYLRVSKTSARACWIRIRRLRKPPRPTAKRGSASTRTAATTSPRRWRILSISTRFRSPPLPRKSTGNTWSWSTSTPISSFPSSCWCWCSSCTCWARCWPSAWGASSGDCSRKGWAGCRWSTASTPR